MGDHFQIIVDLDATAADAAELGGRALDWLVREGIVRAGRTDCVPGARTGHPPGEKWAKAVLEPDWEPTDGLDIKKGRRVFLGGQGDARYAICPRCAARTWFYTERWEPIEEASTAFDEAIRTWDATGEAKARCPSCEQDSDLTAWRWDGDYYAFGYLGLEFWNWPVFAPRFLADLARVLDDHRVAAVGGKL
ncbi:hypothetical protein [Actinomadura sp. WMMA1423]|uniref:hypothetical protein n=1 Tax=Actinomadura sp. WMMA1423 TaxID=2591108 RepID=UPI0011478078|nr:hypothetical protein [Actinomadura sp. WMMA1423]